MEDLNRRKFLKLVGVGSGAIAVGAVVPKMGLAGVGAKGLSGLGAKGLSGSGGKELFAFRAVGGLPSGNLPSFASYVLEGHVNPITLSGVVTRTVYAGPPEAMSQIAIPGLTRVVRVDGLRDVGGLLHVRGVTDDHSQLREGESPTMEFRIDRAAGVAHAPFFGTLVPLRLVVR